MIKLFTNNGKSAELVPVDQIMIRTLPLRCTLQSYVLVYPDGYLAAFQPPPKKEKNG